MCRLVECKEIYYWYHYDSCREVCLFLEILPNKYLIQLSVCRFVSTCLNSNFAVVNSCAFTSTQARGKKKVLFPVTRPTLKKGGGGGKQQRISLIPMYYRVLGESA
jgi:hypothetical protein